jgi:hypothetical protein
MERTYASVLQYSNVYGGQKNSTANLQPFSSLLLVDGASLVLGHFLFHHHQILLHPLEVLNNEQQVCQQAGNVGQHMPSMSEALGSISSISSHQKKKKLSRATHANKI